MNKLLTLENRIEYEMKSFSGKFAVYANDLKGTLIAKDCDEEWETASCIKFPILCEFANQINQGHLQRDQKMQVTDENRVNGSGIIQLLSKDVELSLIDVATLMIVVSDNIATNMMIDLLGIDAINKCMRDLGLNKTILHNKINFELYNQIGTTTAREYGLLFEKLYKRELFSPFASDLMIDILSKQQYNTIMTKYLPAWLLDSENTGESEVVKVVSKSGSLENCRNDGGVIYTPYGGFVAVVLTKDFSDRIFYSDHEAYKFAPRITRLLFDQYISKEGKF